MRQLIAIILFISLSVCIGCQTSTNSGDDPSPGDGNPPDLSQMDPSTLLTTLENDMNAWRTTSSNDEWLVKIEYWLKITTQLKEKWREDSNAQFAAEQLHTNIELLQDLVGDARKDQFKTIRAFHLPEAKQHLPA